MITTDGRIKTLLSKAIRKARERADAEARLEETLRERWGEDVLEYLIESDVGGGAYWEAMTIGSSLNHLELIRLLDKIKKKEED